MNLARSIAATVRQKEDEQPYLIPIGERAARILELFEDRQLTTRDALRELEKALEEFTAAQRELKEKGFDINAFSIYWILRRRGIGESEDLALEVDDLFGRFPNYRESPNERRELKAEMYKVLLPKVGRTVRAEVVEAILNARRK